MPEDVAIASTKSEVDTCTDDRDIDRPKSADRQTDGQTDRQTAFQLYIVDNALCTGKVVAKGNIQILPGKVVSTYTLNHSLIQSFDPNNVETKDIAIYIVHLIMFTCGIGFLILNQP